MTEMSATDVNIRLLVVELAGEFTVFALALFIPASSIRWTARWCFLILFFGFVIIMVLWLLKRNSGSLQERITGLGKSDQEAGDKVIMRSIVIFFIACLS